MSKGIAIRTILLLLIGCVVAGVIIYLVYSSTTAPTLSATECQARLLSWCTSCRNRAAGGTWGAWPMSPEMISDCMGPLKDVGIGIDANSNCGGEQTDACAMMGVE